MKGAVATLCRHPLFLFLKSIFLYILRFRTFKGNAFIFSKLTSRSNFVSSNFFTIYDVCFRVRQTPISISASLMGAVLYRYEKCAMKELGPRPGPQTSFMAHAINKTCPHKRSDEIFRTVSGRTRTYTRKL